MTSSTPLHVRRRPAALFLALTFAVAACGGSGDESSSDIEAVDGATIVTDPPEADADPVDDTTTTVADTTTTSTTSSTTTTVVEAPVASEEAYCDTSREYWIPGGGLSYFASDDSEGVRLAFDDLLGRIQGPIDAAPSDPARQSAIDAQDVLGQLVPLLDQVDFDPERFGELGDDSQFESLISQFQQSQDRLGDFLLEQCGFVRDDLVDLALDYANSRATLPIEADADPLPLDDTDSDSDTPSGDSTSITDDTGNIEVTVPAAWTDVNGEPGPNEDRLIASTDQDGFLDGFDVPGMFIEAVDTPDGNGDIAAPAALAVIVENYTASGCVPVSEEPYSDPAYSGAEAVLSCVPGFETRVIAGTPEDGIRIFVVVMVIEAGDTATRDLIADSFLI